jgi:hypothetical protein
MRINERRQLSPAAKPIPASPLAEVVCAHLLLSSVAVFAFLGFVSSHPIGRPVTVRQRMHPYVFRNFSVYDAIMYAGESRLFYLRVRSLDAYVDYFVVGYSCLTFQNNPAPPLSYAPLEAELSEYDDKIIVFRTCARRRKMRAWDRESSLRMFLQWSIAQLHPNHDDLVMNCDCDEIPTQPSLEWVFAHPPATFYKFRGLYFIGCSV